MLRFRSLQPFVRIASSVRLLPPALSSHPLQVQSTVIPLNASLCVRRFGWFSSAPAAAAAPALAATASAAPVSVATASMGSSSAVAAAPVAAAPVTQVVEVAAGSAAAAASSATPVNVASAASGIGWPTDWLEALLSSMHTAAGLPWWATIACATLIFRSAMFPLVVKQMKNIGQMAKLRPEMEALQASVKGSGNMFSNPAATEAHTEKLKLLFKKHDVHPLKSFLGMFAQAPLFITFFWTLQNMAERNSSFTTGGFGQFLDLSSSDPSGWYVLPLITGATFLANVERGSEVPMDHETQAKQKTMKNVMRGLAALMVPLTASFPVAIFAYWIPSNIFTFFQGSVMKLPVVRTTLGLPDMAAIAAANKVNTTAEVIIPSATFKNKPLLRAAANAPGTTTAPAPQSPSAASDGTGKPKTLRGGVKSVTKRAFFSSARRLPRRRA